MRNDLSTKLKPRTKLVLGFFTHKKQKTPLTNVNRGIFCAWAPAFAGARSAPSVLRRGSPLGHIDKSKSALALELAEINSVAKSRTKRPAGVRKHPLLL